MYHEYEAVSRFFTGWPLSEIKEMTTRERRYWVDVLQWYKELSHG